MRFGRVDPVAVTAHGWAGDRFPSLVSGWEDDCVRFRTVDGQAEVYTVSADGGPPRRLTITPAWTPFQHGRRIGRWILRHVGSLGHAPALEDAG